MRQPFARSCGRIGREKMSLLVKQRIGGRCGSLAPGNITMLVTVQDSEHPTRPVAQAEIPSRRSSEIGGICRSGRPSFACPRGNQRFNTSVGPWPLAITSWAGAQQA
jgi:hypothetical protein